MPMGTTSTEGREISVPVVPFARATLEPVEGSRSLGTSTFVPSHFVPFPHCRWPAACPIVRTGAEEKSHGLSVLVSVGVVQPNANLVGALRRGLTAAPGAHKSVISAGFRSRRGGTSTRL